MTYLLYTHPSNYNLSFTESLLSLATLSSAPYAKRHWDLSTQSPQHCLGHRMIAVLQAIPIVGLLFGLIERIIVFVTCSKRIFTETKLLDLPAPIQKVPLQKASQYNMPGEQPPACTFHAISAIQQIRNHFNEVFNQIARSDSNSKETFF